MASLRGAEAFWSGATVNSGDKSALTNPGVGPYVALYINNSGGVNATFKVQASAVVNPTAGRNSVDSTADGGLTWFDYSGATALVVNAGATLCFDLAPYSPPFLRLVRTDALAATTITALITSDGPN